MKIAFIDSPKAIYPSPKKIQTFKSGRNFFYALKVYAIIEKGHK